VLTPSDVLSLPIQAHTHDHEYHQLVIVLDGDTDFDIQGQGKQLAPGGGCVVPSSEGHAFAGLGENRIMVVNLPIPPQQAITQEEYELVSRMFDQASFFQLNARLKLLATSLSSELEQHPDDKLLARACGNTLLSAIRHQLTETDIVTPTTAGRRLDIDKLDQYIDNNLSRRIQMQELAQFCFLSVSQFHQRFKEKMGLTPHQYVQQKRLKHAQFLLANGYSASQAASLCGFSSQSAMTTLFSQELGISPVRFQKLYLT